MLRGNQVTQHIPGLRRTASGQQRAGAFHEVAGPYQVIATTVILVVTPGHAQARDHRAGIELVHVAAQHHPRGVELRLERGLASTDVDAFMTTPMPVLPCRDMLGPGLLEGLGQ